MFHPARADFALMCRDSSPLLNHLRWNHNLPYNSDCAVRHFASARIGELCNDVWRLKSPVKFVIYHAFRMLVCDLNDRLGSIPAPVWCFNMADSLPCMLGRYGSIRAL